jgi:crotonobetainyl-CoA:carnitine CoA-transferase CaiB-like acyl-CoA transferase
MGHGMLDGLRVADFSRVLAGPYATMVLADFGADVIKIEPPGGDDTRRWRPPVDSAGQSTYFGSVNRNKRSISLDLANPADLAEARRLATSADVLVENFRPGVMQRFGLAYDDVRAVNPGVVYCSITGFGSGQGAALAGYDLLAQAVGGLMSITGSPGGEPTKVGVAVVDVLTGQNAVTGILLALRERDRSGDGQLVEVNLLQSLLASLTNQTAAALATGRPPAALGNDHPSIAPYSTYRARDRELVIAVGNDKQFRALAIAIDDPGLAEDARFADNPARVAHHDELRERIEARLAAAPADRWVGELNAAGIPAGLVHDIPEAIAFAADLGLTPVVAIGAADEPAHRTVANPVGLSASPPEYRRRPPRLGEHSGADWLNAPSKGPQE